MQTALKLRKQLIALKNRARNLNIHSREADQHLISALKDGKYHRKLVEPQNDNFWFKIDQDEEKPIWANIKRIDTAKFRLYITYDRHLEIADRVFGSGGIQNPSPDKVSEALDNLFSVAFNTKRARPEIKEDKVEDLPLFAEKEKVAS